MSFNTKDSLRINSKKIDRPYQCLYVDQNIEVDIISAIAAKKQHITWREPEYKPVPSEFKFTKPRVDPDAKYYGPIATNYKSLSSY